MRHKKEERRKKKKSCLEQQKEALGHRLDHDRQLVRRKKTLLRRSITALKKMANLFNGLGRQAGGGGLRTQAYASKGNHLSKGGDIMSYGKRENTHSIKYQGLKRIEAMKKAGIGTSKHKDKHSNPAAIAEKIYSDATAADYARKWVYYCEAMKAAGYKYNGHTPRTLEEAAGYMPQYIKELSERGGSQGTGMSAWTIRSYFAAAAKVMGLTAKNYALPARHTAEIKRSRGEAKMDSHFSEVLHGDLVSFCKATGLRNFKELQQIRGQDLIDHGDGSYAIRVTGKGGRIREAPVVGSKEAVAAVAAKMRERGSERVWEHVPRTADIHAYRAIYAKRVYNQYVRDIATLSKKDIYVSGNGIAYDRAALMAASQALGHSRCDVVVHHYMWSEDEAKS